MIFDDRRGSFLSQYPTDVTHIRLIAMNPERPFEGNVPGDGDGPTYEWLDEWLCEYVDGAMDPSLEAVFEKYVEANPELKAHVERLKETRDLLCNCGLPAEPSEEMAAEICEDVECDVPPPAPASEAARNQPLATLGLVSSVAAALVIGFLLGAMVVGPISSRPPSETPTTDRATSKPKEEASSLQRTQSTMPDRTDRRAPLPLAPADSGDAPSPITTTGAR